MTQIMINDHLKKIVPDHLNYPCSGKFVEKCSGNE